MTQTQRRLFLLRYLLNEQASYQEIAIPENPLAQKRLLRALLNVRMPSPATDEFLRIQDAYLQAELSEKGIIDCQSLPFVEKGIRIRQGDITLLQCDAIVNAANSGLLGCFCPNHGCIDNAIHTYAGIQLRAACAAIMEKQGHEEAAGIAKITPAFNLPCKYVLHTVGPIVEDIPTSEDEALLAACYRSCLRLAAQNGLKGVAFCCISTGEFHFPNERAAQIAVKTVRDFLSRAEYPMEVIFNVFKNEDFAIYQRLFHAN